MPLSLCGQPPLHLNLLFQHSPRIQTEVIEEDEADLEEAEGEVGLRLWSTDREHLEASLLRIFRLQLLQKDR